MPEVLITDALIFLLLALAIVFACYAHRHEHVAEPWRRVVRSKTAMSSMVVLSFYIAIGLFDSMHFHPRLSHASSGDTQYSSGVISIFDWMVGPLRTGMEKTYSAPLATHLAVKEPIEQPDGSLLRDYPRLFYGGAHLDDPARAGTDILGTCLEATLEALTAWILLLAAFVFSYARRHHQRFRPSLRQVLSGTSELPWHAFFYTVLVMVLITFLLIHLGGKYHVFGTDKVGEDVLYQTLKSIRTGLVIGTLTTLVMLPFAVLLGIMAGYFKGWVDDVIQFIYTTLNAIPGVLLIAAAVLMMHVYMSNHPEQFESLTERADFRLLFLCLILGVTSWTGLCRLLRGETFKVREMDYIEAAQAFGVSHVGIIMRHILPNVMHIVLITIVLDFSYLVLAEAVLSYIEIGVDPTMHSWGNMINSARLELARDPVVWWSLVAAFIFMFTLVLFANLFADVVRDALDPRIRSRIGSGERND